MITNLFQLEHFESIMNRMPNKQKTVNELLSVYRELISRPKPVDGRIFSDTSPNCIIAAKWSQRSLERGQNVTFQTTHLLNNLSETVRHLVTADTGSELFSGYSATERFKCVVRLVPDGGKKKQFLEIWEDSRLARNVDLGALDLHGDIYPIGDLGSVDWAATEDKVVYIAEQKRVKPEPFFSSKTRTPSDDDEKAFGEEYTYIQDWGEQMTGQCQTAVVVYDLETGIRVLEGIPDGYCAGQVIWDENGNGVYGVVYKNEPRLGMIYCTNRDGRVFHLSLTGDFSLISKPDFSPRSVRLCCLPNENVLVWLEAHANGPHHSSQTLMKMNLTTREIKELVLFSEDDDARGFAGLYKSLIPRCFSSNGNFYLDTICGNKCHIFQVCLHTGKLSWIIEGELLDVKSDLLLINNPGTNQASFPNLYLYYAETSLKRSVPISPATPVTDVEYEAKIINFPVKDVDHDEFNVILVKPINVEKKCPLIVFPHGGPHSANWVTYMLEPSYFAKLGFAVLLINYRGSLGMGEKAVNCLLGKIGTLDVGDVHHAVNVILKENDYLDAEKIVAYGGSHGGFLSLQLAGQYPEFYKSVVVRNPVIDLPSMFATSDIPDWVSAEIGSTYKPGQLPTSAEHALMTEMSPIRWIDQYKAPTLFLCGNKDQRVPMSQSLYYHRLLTARGLKTKLHIYPDDHALGTVPVHVDALINSTLWIYESFGIES